MVRGNCPPPPIFDKISAKLANCRQIFVKLCFFNHKFGVWTSHFSLASNFSRWNEAIFRFHKWVKNVHLLDLDTSYYHFWPRACVAVLGISFCYIWLALGRIMACLSFKWLWRHFVDPVVFNKAEQCIHLPCFVATLSKKWRHTSDRLVIETSSNPPSQSSYPVSCSNRKNFFGGDRNSLCFPKKEIFSIRTWDWILWLWEWLWRCFNYQWSKVYCHFSLNVAKTQGKFMYCSSLFF